MEKSMELKELTDRTLDLFGVTAPEQLGHALLAACGDPDKLRSFCELVGGDVSTDWLQKIYQYYLADRKEKTFTRGQKWSRIKLTRRVLLQLIG